MPPEAAAPVVLRAQLGPRSPQGAPRRRPPALPGLTRRPAYVARLLALGHQLRGLLDRGEVAGVGELARRLGVSQPRVSQLVALSYLAPSVQAEIAAMEAVDGVEPMSERPLRQVLRSVGWRGQQDEWENVRRRCSSNDCAAS